MPKTIDLADVELLHESLAELERAYQHERAVRLETEGLLSGLRALNEARDTRQLFDTLAEVLRDPVPFEDAFLIGAGGRGGYRVVRSTARVFLGLRWSPRETLKRVLDGETVALFDTHRVAEWAELPGSVLAAARSAVMVPIRSESMRSAMVFVHSSPAFFAPSHLHLLKRFSPLIDQALAGIEAREGLEKERNLAQAAIREKRKEVRERRRAEAEIKRVRDLMASAIECSPVYLWELDTDNRYTFAEGTQKVLGFAPEEIVGRNVAYFFDDPVDANRDLLLVALGRRQPFENLICHRRRKDGSRLWVSISGSPITDEEGRFIGHRGASMDVTETTEAKIKLERMALHDALTGLANRRKFLDHFTAAQARLQRHGEPVSMLALDLDHFKRINDAYGHPAGDEVLVAVARVLERNVRRTDLVARFGGEEFMVLLPDSSLAGAAEAAEKLRAALEAEPISVDAAGGRVTLKMTVSIGAATLTREEPASFDDLMGRADQALYAAKLAGRNRVCIEGE
jgi:diguanylate cyclase (GGDEF)-like protein/PAS domain S-box-containing protein